MTSHQNYTTIDSYSLSRNLKVRVSQIHEELQDPKDPKSPLRAVDDASNHYVVAMYLYKNYDKFGKAENSASTTLVHCEHFIGPTAEDDAMSYFLSLVDPEEFPPKEMLIQNFPSWQEKQSYFDANAFVECYMS